MPLKLQGIGYYNDDSTNNRASVLLIKDVDARQAIGKPVLITHKKSLQVGRVSQLKVVDDHLDVELIVDDEFGDYVENGFSSLSIGYSINKRTGEKSIDEFSLCNDPVLKGCDIYMKEKFNSENNSQEHWELKISMSTPQTTPPPQTTPAPQTTPVVQQNTPPPQTNPVVQQTTPPPEKTPQEQGVNQTVRPFPTKEELTAISQKIDNLDDARMELVELGQITNEAKSKLQEKTKEAEEKDKMIETLKKEMETLKQSTQQKEVDKLSQTLKESLHKSGKNIDENKIQEISKNESAREILQIQMEEAQSKENENMDLKRKLAEMEQKVETLSKVKREGRSQFSDLFAMRQEGSQPQSQGQQAPQTQNIPTPQQIKQQVQNYQQPQQGFSSSNQQGQYTPIKSVGTNGKSFSVFGHLFNGGDKLIKQYSNDRIGEEDLPLYMSNNCSNLNILRRKCYEAGGYDPNTIIVADWTRTPFKKE